MTLRRLCGLLLAVLAAWLLWGGIHAVNVVMARGSSLADAVLSPPTGLLRLVGSTFALLGGLIAFADKPSGAWIASLGTAIFVLLTALMIGLGASSVLWWDEAVYSVVLVLLTGLLVFQVRI